MRPVARAGRWAWGLCGLATAAALAVPGTLLIVSAGVSPAPARAGSPPPQVPIQTRTVTVPQPITSLNVHGYAGLIYPPGLIQVTAAPVTHVQVTEIIAYYGRPPAVVQSVSGGRLFLADPACADGSCSVSFAVTVPPGVTVTAAGGPLFISGTSGANLDSGGAPVSATSIHGPLTVSTHGGPLQINGLTGPLRADTGGGQVIATRVTAATAVVTTGSGPAQITFSAAPESVTLSTGGGLAALSLPGGPYALTANSDGAPQTIGIATSSAAHRSITITTGGGPLVISSGEIPGTYGPPGPVSGIPPPLPFPSGPRLFSQSLSIAAARLREGCLASRKDWVTTLDSKRNEPSACIIPRGSPGVRPRRDSRPLRAYQFRRTPARCPGMAADPRTLQVCGSSLDLHAAQPHTGGNRRVARRLAVHHQPRDLSNNAASGRKPRWIRSHG